MGKPFGSRTDKFRPGITFTIFRNKFHSPIKRRKGRNLVSKMAFKECNTLNFRLEPSVRKTGLSFHMFRYCRCCGKFSSETTQKVVHHLLSQILNSLIVERLLVTDFCSNDFSEIPLACLFCQLKPIPDILVENISKFFY